MGGVNTTNKATLAVEDGDRVELEVESELPCEWSSLYRFMIFYIYTISQFHSLCLD